MARVILRVTLVLAIISVALVTALPSQADVDSSEAAATLTLGLLNEWRLQEGLSPLRVNATLTQMALRQANHVLPIIDSISDEHDYHVDGGGRNAIRRARELFNWPDYGRTDQVEVGENAAEYSVTKAIKFWKESAIHRKAATNKVYREVGIAAIQFKGRYLIYTVLGARPGVYPVLISPDKTKLYLTNEFSRYADLSPDRLSIRIYDENGKLLGEPRQWAKEVPAPAGITERFSVKYTFNDGETIDEFTTEAYLSIDQAILPGSTLTVSRQLAVPTLVAAQPTTTAPPPTPTVGQVSAVATNTRQPATRAPLLIASTPVPTAVAQQPTSTSTPLPPTDAPTAAPTIAPTASTGPADLLVVYDAFSLSVINVSGKPLNLTGLQVNRTAIERWQAVASFPVERFGAGHCLQFALTGRAPTLPAECKSVRSELQVDAARLFWTQAAFPISLNGQVIATCQPNAGRCEVDIP